MRSLPTARACAWLTRTTRARRYAEDALAQLARANGGALPALALRDWPDFPVRGFMLDVSRDRVPTRDTLAHLVARPCAPALQPPPALHRAHLRLSRARGGLARRLADHRGRRALARSALRRTRDRARRQPEHVRAHGALAPARTVSRARRVAGRMEHAGRRPPRAERARAHARERRVRARPRARARAPLREPAREHQLRRDLRARHRPAAATKSPRAAAGASTSTTCCA